jgi:hypothetical protein
MSTKSQLPKQLFMVRKTITFKKMLTFQAMSTFSAKHPRMEVWDHRRIWRLVSPISSDPDIQKMLPVVHLISLQANQSA